MSVKWIVAIAVGAIAFVVVLLLAVRFLPKSLRTGDVYPNAQVMKEDFDRVYVPRNKDLFPVVALGVRENAAVFFVKDGPFGKLYKLEAATLETQLNQIPIGGYADVLEISQSFDGRTAAYTYVIERKSGLMRGRQTITKTYSLEDKDRQ